MLHDLIIIGAGPAGLSAALYAARKKINLLVLADGANGQTGEAHLVENYLGLDAISGMELAEKFRSHAKKFDIKIKDGADVEKILPKEGIFEIIAANGSFSAKSVIVATGKKYRALQVPGAKEFEGKGITYCATCDAPLFKNKAVAVIGAGDAGQDAAWQLTKYASKIYLLNKYSELKGDDSRTQEELKNHPQVEIFNDCEPVEVKGDKFVKALVFKCNGDSPAELDYSRAQRDSQIKEIAVEGIFVEIGSVPASKFLAGMVKLNSKEEVIIDPKTNMTSVPGIFAAGDITDISHKQMIIAAGEGAKAALSAYEYLKSQNI